MTAASAPVLWQAMAVGAIVLACAVYVAWTLAPAAWRRPVARLLLRQRRLAGVAALRAAARPPTAGGCACTGCDRAVAPASPGMKVVRIVPRGRPSG